MVTIQTTPAQILFAGNPVLYKIYSDNQFVVAARRCSFNLVFSLAETEANRTLTFTFADKTVVFKTVMGAGPDDSGLQLPSAANDQDIHPWSEGVFECLKLNFDISSRFTLTFGPYNDLDWLVHFEAISEGAIYTPVVTTTLRTVSPYFFIPGLDAVPRDNFSIIGGIWDKNFKQLLQDRKPVDPSGNVSFNFSEYLSVLLEHNAPPGFTFPFDPTALVKVFNGYVLPFYAGFAELFGGQIQKLHFDQLRYALPGGLNRETLVAYNAQNLDFFSVSQNLKSFMTWAPIVKATGKSVPEKLFFYIYNGCEVEYLELVVKIFFTDGTFGFIHSGPFSAAQNSVIECSVGYGHLDLETRFPAKTVSFWEVNIDNYQGGALSETKTFQLDPLVYEHERVFIFQNSYGRAYDVVRFTGKGSVNIELDYAINNYRTLEKDTFFNAPSKKSEASEVQKMTTNTGWVSREMKDYLREMLLSAQAFELKNNLLYPIVITTNQAKEYFMDGRYLYNLDIDYDRAYRDFFFQ